MRNLTLAAVAAALIAGPALAQTVAPEAPAAPMAAAPAQPAISPNGPSETEISDAGDAFGEDMEAMQGELEAAKTAAGADTAKANADAAVIEAKYQAKADAFGTLFKAFADANPTLIPAEAVTQIQTQIHGAPAMVRQGVMSAPAEAAAAPAN